MTYKLLFLIFLTSCTPIIQTEIPIKVANNTCQVTEVRSSTLMTVAYLTCNLNNHIVFPILNTGTSQMQVAGTILKAGSIVGAGAIIGQGLGGIDTGVSIAIPGGR